MELVQQTEQLQAPGLLENIREIVTDLRTKLGRIVGVSLLIASGGAVVSMPTYAATPQAIVGMPFSGQWANESRVAPPYNNETSSHPSVHDAYGFNWATDLFAPKDTAVNVYGSSPQGAVTFKRSSISDTCSSYGANIAGKGVTFDVLVNGTEVGKVKYDHLDLEDIGSGSIASGTKIGEVTSEPLHSSCYQVSHAHVQFKNTTSNYSCYVDHGTPGDGTITANTPLGVLGSTNTAEKQACSVTPIVGGSAGITGAQKPIVLLDFANAVWAKESVSSPGFTQETSNGSARAIAAGGDRQTILDFCNSIWSKSSVGFGSWTQEAPCGAAQEVVVSSDGTRMLRDFCGAVWTKSSGIGNGGWNQETTCDGHKAIAAGGETRLVLNACNAIWAKRGGVGMGGWTQETDCGAAQKIAIGADGTQALIDGCGAVWAKKGVGFGGWNQETDCAGIKAIVVGDGQQLILNACNAVWSRNGIGRDGWRQETNCDSAKAIAVGSNNQNVLISLDDAVWAQTTNGWVPQTGPGSAKTVAAG